MEFNHETAAGVLVMTEFALYLDDSGHPSNQPFLVVGGYVATESQWLAFEPEWNATLDRFHLVKPFHMTVFQHQRYTSLKRDQILSSLAAVTKRHTLRPFVIALDLGAWKKVNEEFTLEECHGAPFGLAARALARHVNDWKREVLGPDDRLLSFVEEGTKHYGEMEQVFKRDKLPILNKVPKSMPQVQPCDILAWETFNYLRAGEGSRLSKNLKRLTHYMAKREDFGGIIWEWRLRKLCEETNVYPREQMNPGDTIAFHSERKRKRKRTIK
jgi:hypothetical protein